MDAKQNDPTKQKDKRRPTWQRALFILAILLLVALLYSPLENFGRELYRFFH